MDAAPELRYSRIQSRQSETDHISFETFLENEQREMQSTDPNKQNIGKCITMADFVFENNGDINELNTKVEKILHGIRQ